MFDRRLSHRAATLLLLLVAACGESTESSTANEVELPIPTPKIVSFEVLPETVTAGTPATLHWTTRDAVSIAIADGAGNPLALADAEVASGSLEVQPVETTSYTLTATGAEGAAGPVWRTVTLVVEPVSPDAPTIEAFAAAPQAVAIGDEVVLSWRTSNAARLTLKDDAAVEIDLGDADLGEGQVTVRPARTTTTYSLIATGPGGRANATVSVEVAGLPRVSHFFLDPIAPVSPGEEVNLEWETIDAQHVVVLRGDEELVSSDVELSGSLRIVLDDNAEFRIVATGHGQTATAEVLAQVGPRIVSFAASNHVVRLGDPIDLTWQLEGADRATIEGPGDYQLQLVGPDLVSGAATVNLAARGDFVLTAFRGQVSRTAAIALELTEAPRVRSLSVDQPIVTADALHPATVTLSWVQDGADTCTIFRNNVEIPEFTGFPCGRVGSAAIQLFGNSTLRFVGTNAVGSHSAVIDVQAVPTATIAVFASNPARRMTPGSTVQLSWEVTEAVAVSMEKNGAPFSIGATAFTGSASDRVDFDSTYVLTAVNSLGFPTEATVEVRAGTPVILSAVAQPAFAGVGAQIMLRWTADGGETLTVVDGGGTELFRTTDPATIDNGSLPILVPTVAGTYHYLVRSTNGAGAFDEESVEVIVSDGPMIESFTANKTSLSLGENLILSWVVRNDPSGNVPTLTLTDNYANSFNLTGKNPNLGSVTIVPAEEGPHFYTLTASTGPTRTQATATAGSAVSPIEVSVPPRALAFTATPDRVSTVNGTVVPDVVLAWQTENAVEITLWESDAAGNVYPPAFQRFSLAQGTAQAVLDAGSHTVHPTVTTWYVLRVKNRVGSFVDRRLKVIVDPPEILTLGAVPPEIVEGQTSTLSWTTRNATVVNFDPPTGPLAVTPSQFPYVDISSTGTLSTISGDCGVGVITFPTGFTFPFDGVARSAIWVSTNGFAGFDLSATACEHYSSAFPQDSKRYVQLAPYWCDLDNTKNSPAGQLWSGLGSDAMGEYLVIQFKNWAWWATGSNPSNLNFEIILRRSGIFEYRYGSMSAPTAALASGSTCGIGYQYPTAGSLAVNIFPYGQQTTTPLANTGYVLGSQQPANGSLAVTPTKTTTYTLTAMNSDATAFRQTTVTVWKTPVVGNVRILPAAPEATKPFKIEWTVTNATRVRVLDGSGVEVCNEADPNKVLVGSCMHAEPTGGAKAYTLEVSNGPLAAPMVTITRPFTVNVFPLLALSAFTVTPGEFVAGGTPVTISWTGVGATEVLLLACTPYTGRNTCVDITPVGANPNGGSLTMTMNKSIEFWLRVYDVSYRMRESMKTVWIDAPSVDSFSASATQIPAGSSTTLSWTTTGTKGGYLTGLPVQAPVEVTATSPFIDLTATGTVVPMQPGGTDTAAWYDVIFPNDFAFPWFGAVKSAVRVSTDGWLTFDMSNTTVQLNDFTMPTSSTYKMVNIGPFWDDLTRGTNGTVLYGTGQTASGEKYLAVQWKEFAFGTASYNPSNVNFEVLLFEGGDLEFRYGTMTSANAPVAAGDMATMGWQSPDLTRGKMLTAAGGDVVPGGLANRSWRFPMSVGPDSNVVVSPTESTTYRLCVTNAGMYLDCEEVRVVVVKPGDILVSELMIAPATEDAEWFEVRNTSPDPIDLAGWMITSGATESFVIPTTSPLVVPPGRFAVFSRSATASGGLTPAIVYGSALTLADTADEVRVLMGAVVIDSVSWSGTGWPVQAGKSIALETSVMTRSMTSNDAAGSWCATAVTYGDGTYFGSPGALGNGCLTSGAYQWYQLDQASGTPFIDIENTGLSIFSYNSSSPYLTPSIPLGFAMPYFGDTVSSMQVNTYYGYIAFTPQTTYYYNNVAMPDAGLPNGFIAPFWDYCYTTAGISNIHYQARVVDGHQVMIVQWSRIGPGSMTYGTLDVQAQLWDTGDVALVYRNVNRITTSYGYTNGSSATIGMENNAGTMALQIYYGNTSSLGGPIVGNQSYLFHRR